MTDFLLVTNSIQGVGTFGVMSFNGNQIAVTVECDWLNNEKNISCVPAGEYDLIWYQSLKFGRSGSSPYIRETPQ